MLSYIFIQFHLNYKSPLTIVVFAVLVVFAPFVISNPFLFFPLIILARGLPIYIFFKDPTSFIFCSFYCIFSFYFLFLLFFFTCPRFILLFFFYFSNRQFPNFFLLYVFRFINFPVKYCFSCILQVFFVIVQNIFIYLSHGLFWLYFKIYNYVSIF